MGLQTENNLNSMNPTVMILAAGIGSRLRPLTDETPKALLKFRGETMLDHVLNKLIDQGFRRFVINIHHHPEKIKRHLLDYRKKGLEIIISDESERLMDTGGAIIKARTLLEGFGPFIVHNVDIYSDLDLRSLYGWHLKHNPLATLAVKERDTSRNLLIDKSGYLAGWRNNQTGEVIMVNEYGYDRALAFSGIQVIDPRIFDVIDNREPFSIMQAYLELAGNHPVLAFEHPGDEWINMADRNNFEELS